MHPARADLPALGEFLRARRAQLKPEEFGLPAGQRRRTPGLRREEAAMLCGISPTWLTWIEQGRITSVSVPTLAAIARGLKLSDAERSYLFGIAARRDPAPPRAAAAPAAPALRALVDAIHAPAYLLDRHWDVREFNRQAGALFGDWLGSRRRAVPSPGLLQYVFLDPRARRFIDQWEARAHRLVAEYRADTAAWRDDPVRQQRVAELRAASGAFAAAWDAQQVLEREGGRRVFRHPARGRCVYTQTTLRVAQQPDLKLVVLLPA